MAQPGKHGKMLILAFADSKAAESGGVAEADDSFEALINPENYTLSYKLKFSQGGQGQGFDACLGLDQVRLKRLVVLLIFKQ